MNGGNSSLPRAPPHLPCSMRCLTWLLGHWESANPLRGSWGKELHALHFLEHSLRAAGAPLFILAFY